MQFYLALPLLGWLMHRLGRSGKTLNQSRGRISYGIYLWHFAIANFWFLNGNLVGSEPLPILAFRGRTGFLGGTGSGGGDPRAAPPGAVPRSVYRTKEEGTSRAPRHNGGAQDRPLVTGEAP
jgi:hypothetical protein